MHERAVVASLFQPGMEEVELPSIENLDKALGLVGETPRYDQETIETLAALGLPT